MIDKALVACMDMRSRQCLMRPASREHAPHCIPLCRSDLLRRVERWTYGRKIKLCKGVSAQVISASEAILAHGLSQDEIDRWMEAYRRKDFEALKVGYARKLQGI